MFLDVWDFKSRSQWYEDFEKLGKFFMEFAQCSFQFTILTTAFVFDDDFTTLEGEEFDRSGKSRSFRMLGLYRCLIV